MVSILNGNRKLADKTVYSYGSTDTIFDPPRFYRTVLLKVLFIEVDLPKSGNNWKAFIKGRGTEIFS
jgi:hypothetical protein